MTPKIDVPRALDTVALLNQFGHANAKNLADYTTALMEALKLLKRGTCWCEMAIGHPLVNQHSLVCQATSALLPTKSEGEENESP